MSNMRKQRAIYAAVLSLVLVVTMGISLFTASFGDTANDSEQDSGYTASLPESETSEASMEEEPEVPDTEEVQQNIEDPNESIEGADASDSEEAPEASADASGLTEEQLTTDLDVPDSNDLEANGIFFDPATDAMAWPVSGNVVMEYSLDSVIYDATLDQYRVNDSISISAEANEAVCAAAAGIVAEIGYTEEMGNYVVLEHGNGFRTTYGQLESPIPVAVAQRVGKGETIGQLAEPAWYGVALGDHVDFKVTLDGEPVDPLAYLEYDLEE